MRSRHPFPGGFAPCRVLIHVALPVLAAACVLAGPVHAAPPPPMVSEIRVERVKPRKEKVPTLRFLKENRDFIRARFDVLRQTTVERPARAAPLDPRYLAYQSMLAGILAAEDSIATAENALERHALLESITDLGTLEAQLDQMERLLAAQRIRLGMLQKDFAGRQATALMVVLGGYPAGVPLADIAVTLEDGTILKVALTDEQRQSLRQGGILEIFHGFVEPREQVIEVGLAGAPWPAGDAVYVTLDPTRDRLTFLKLDLSGVQAAGGGTGIHATTWLHDAEMPSGER